MAALTSEYAASQRRQEGREDQAKHALGWGLGCIIGAGIWWWAVSNDKVPLGIAAACFGAVLLLRGGFLWVTNRIAEGLLNKYWMEEEEFKPVDEQKTYPEVLKCYRDDLEKQMFLYAVLPAIVLTIAVIGSLAHSALPLPPLFVLMDAVAITTILGYVEIIHHVDILRGIKHF